METCGYADQEILRAALPFVDLFLFDIKDTDNIRHKQYTGVSNTVILNNLQLINDLNARIRLRCILVNGINANDTHYEKIANIAQKIKNFEGVEFIPYHAYGGTKATFLGLEDNGREEWIPPSEALQRAKDVLKSHNVPVFWRMIPPV